MAEGSWPSLGLQGAPGPAAGLGAPLLLPAGPVAGRMPGPGYAAPAPPPPVALLPLQQQLVGLLDKLQAGDKLRLFSQPPAASDWPTYSVDVETPVDFSLLRRLVHQGAYRSLDQFAGDFRQLCKNAMLHVYPHLMGRTNVAVYADALLDYGNLLLGAAQEAASAQAAAANRFAQRRANRPGGEGATGAAGAGGSAHLHSTGGKGASKKRPPGPQGPPPGLPPGVVWPSGNSAEAVAARARLLAEYAEGRYGRSAPGQRCDVCVSMKIGGCGSSSAHPKCRRYGGPFVKGGADGGGAAKPPGSSARPPGGPPALTPSARVGRPGPGLASANAAGRTPPLTSGTPGNPGVTAVQLDSAMQRQVAANLRLLWGLPAAEPGATSGTRAAAAVASGADAATTAGPGSPSQQRPVQKPDYIDASLLTPVLAMLESGRFATFASIRENVVHVIDTAVRQQPWAALWVGPSPTGPPQSNLPALGPAGTAADAFRTANAKAVGSVYHEARVRASLPLSIRSNTEAYVQGHWRQAPYECKPYEVLTEYVLAEPGLEGSEQLITKLGTALHGGCDGGSCMRSEPAAVGDYNLEAMRFVSSCSCLAASVECDAHCACDQDACANRPVSSGRMLELERDLREGDVWGIDCYTRRNIHDAILESDSPLLSAATDMGRRHFAEMFVERVLMTAVNEQGAMGWDLMQALRSVQNRAMANKQQHAFAAAQAVAARLALVGPAYFRVHPKGRGLIAASKLLPRSCVSPYLGELHAPWRWLEIQDAIKKAAPKGSLPDFYNILLERPRADPAGYDILFVDAAAKGSFASRMSHSCSPNCHAVVMAGRGKLHIAVFTLRELQVGEELTFDYGAMTEDPEELKAAVCLCGSVKCRGTYLYYSNATSFSHVIATQHTFPDRAALLLRAGLPGTPAESAREAALLERHGLRSAALGGAPAWLVRWVAATLAFIDTEQALLPDSLVKTGKGWTPGSAATEAKGISDARLQNLLITLDKVKHCLSAPGQLAQPPLTFLSPAATAEHLWSGPVAIARQAVITAAPALCDKCGKAAVAQLGCAAGLAAAVAAAPGGSGLAANTPIAGAGPAALAAANAITAAASSRRAVKTAVLPHVETAGCRALKQMMALLPEAEAWAAGAGGSLTGAAGTPGADGGSAEAAPAAPDAAAAGSEDAGLAALAAARSGLLALEAELRAADGGALGPHSLLADVLRMAARTQRFFTATRYNPVVSPPVHLRACDLPDGCAMPVPVAATERKLSRGDRAAPAAAGPGRSAVRISCVECNKRHTGGCGTERAKKWCLRMKNQRARAEVIAAATPGAAPSPTEGEGGAGAGAGGEGGSPDAAAVAAPAEPAAVGEGERPSADDVMETEADGTTVVAAEPPVCELAEEEDAAPTNSLLARAELASRHLSSEAGKGSPVADVDAAGPRTDPAATDGCEPAALLSGDAPAPSSERPTPAGSGGGGVLEDSDADEDMRGPSGGGQSAEPAAGDEEGGDDEGEAGGTRATSAAAEDRVTSQPKRRREEEGEEGEEEGEEEEEEEEEAESDDEGEGDEPGAPRRRVAAGDDEEDEDAAAAGGSHAAPTPAPTAGAGGAAGRTPASAGGSGAINSLLQKKYGHHFIWGQLTNWFKQPVGDPGAKLLEGRREVVALPDPDCCYRGRYGFKERSALLEALERADKKPETGLPVSDVSFLTYRNPARIFGSPFMDAALARAAARPATELPKLLAPNLMNLPAAAPRVEGLAAAQEEALMEGAEPMAVETDAVGILPMAAAAAAATAEAALGADAAPAEAAVEVKPCEPTPEAPALPLPGLRELAAELRSACVMGPPPPPAPKPKPVGRPSGPAIERGQPCTKCRQTKSGGCGTTAAHRLCLRKPPPAPMPALADAGAAPAAEAACMPAGGGTCTPEPAAAPLEPEVMLTEASSPVEESPPLLLPPQPMEH